MKIKFCRSLMALALLALSTLNLQLSTCFAQGSLTPPGPPGATMKSLDQIEPRTIVNATNTPGDANNLFIISQPGSYYLTANIVGTNNENGIEITANNVTLDLNGFSLQGISFTDAGIYISNASTNITVRNGSISGWGGSGAYAPFFSAANLVFERLNVANNYSGIYLNGFGVVRDCNIQENSQGGIVVGDGIVTGCIVNNNGSDGIGVYSVGTVSGCDVLNNGGSGIYLVSGTVSGSTANNNNDFGIYLDSGGTVSGSTANFNGQQGFFAYLGTMSGCTANNNGQQGIYAVSATVSGCTAQYNTYDGILAYSANVSDCTANNNSLSGIAVSGNGSEVVGNTCNGNNTSDSGSAGGIFITGNNNRVEDNHVTASGNTGIAVASIPAGYTNNVIIKNVVSGDGANNYSAPSGNDLGPVGTAATSTSPWANISH